MSNICEKCQKDIRPNESFHPASIMGGIGYAHDICPQKISVPKWLNVDALRRFMLGLPEPTDDQWNYSVTERYPKKVLTHIKLPTKF